MKTISTILAIGVVVIAIIGFIFLIRFAIRQQAGFQEERENAFWKCIENNNELEWCLNHFH